MKNRSTVDHLYFAICETSNRIKIGRSHDPWKRHQQLQAASAVPLRMEVIEGVGHFEPILHRQFRELRLHGEWFSATDELVDFVNKMLLVPDILCPAEIGFAVYSFDQNMIVTDDEKSEIVPLCDITPLHIRHLLMAALCEYEKAKTRYLRLRALDEYLKHSRHPLTDPILTKRAADG